MGFRTVDVGRAARAVRSILRPVGWRGLTPTEEGLERCLLFPREKRATSFDGTEIAYSTFGRRGPWVVLVPGFCCPDNFWRYLVPELEKRHRVIVYDLRGLGLSGLPRRVGFRARGVTANDFSIENHVLDLEAVLDAEGVKQAVLIGHSMGGQIILEAYRGIPERISALVILTASYESPTRTLYGRDLDMAFRGLELAIRSLPRASILVWRSLFLARPALTHRLAQFFRALGPHAKAEDMVTYYRHMAFLDPLVLLKMADAMREHSAADILSAIEVPTLIVAGSSDTFAPPRLAKGMHLAIPHSEIVFLEEGTHGAVIEFPNEVNEAVASFLERRLPERARRSEGGAGPRGPASARRRSSAALR